jgi:hypothetical protein
MEKFATFDYFLLTLLSIAAFGMQHFLYDMFVGGMPGLLASGGTSAYATIHLKTFSLIAELSY